MLSQLETQQRLYSEAQAERDQLMKKISEMEQKVYWYHAVVE